MKPILFALACAMAAPVAADAQIFHNGTGVKVNAAGANSFYLGGFARNTPTSHWCEAARYSSKTLGASYSQRMYVVGDSNKSATRFLVSLDPKGTASQNGPIKSWNIRRDGASLSVAQALDYCPGGIFFPGD